MEHKPVKSSNLESIAYSPETKVMHVRFRGGKTYEYADVPPEVHSMLLNAPSPGSHFSAHIRSVYKGTKL